MKYEIKQVLGTKCSIDRHAREVNSGIQWIVIFQLLHK